MDPKDVLLSEAYVRTKVKALTLFGRMFGIIGLVMVILYVVSVVLDRTRSWDLLLVALLFSLWAWVVAIRRDSLKESAAIHDSIQNLKGS